MKVNLAILLALILSLSWLHPLSEEWGESPSRDPASAHFRFIAPEATSTPPPFDPKTGQRKGVLFDIHTVARGPLSKDTNAYIGAQVLNSRIHSFFYCTNYDFSAQRADSRLDRFATSGKKAYSCYHYRLSKLLEPTTLLSAGPLGPILSLQTHDFDPQKGGILSVVFAHEISKLRKNTYRRIDLRVHSSEGAVTILGPKNEEFDWVNIHLSEDLLRLPNGIREVEVRRGNETIYTYPAQDFTIHPLRR